MTGFTAEDEDVYEFVVGSLGNSTSGSFLAFYIGLAAGLPSGADIAGVHIHE